MRKLPGPWYSNISNLRLKLAVITGQRIHYIQALHEKYGPYVRVSPTEVSVADPQGLSQIHRINSGFTKTKWYQDLTSMERLTVFSMTDTRQHAARRKKFARAFSKTHLRQHWEQTVREKVRLCVARIRDEGTSGTADLMKWWTLMATDISVHLMFGESFQMIEKGEVILFVFHLVVIWLTSLSQLNRYIRVLQSSLKGGGIGSELPFVRWICKYIPIQSFRDMFRGNDFIQEYANIAVKNSKKEDVGQNIFATVIHEAEKGEQMDDTDVKLEATGLIVAGSDTTAVTMTYLVWAVLSNRRLQADLEAEVAALPQDFGNLELESLPLLNAVIQETLRLYGAAPGGLPRMVPAGGVTMNDCFLPTGTTVTTQSYTFHRNAELFPDPYR